MRKWFFGLLFASVCSAQTPSALVVARQLACLTNLLTPMVPVAFTTGTLSGVTKLPLTCVQLDVVSFKLDMTVNPPRLSVVFPTSSGAGPTFVDDEKPGGVVDGVNLTFTLANAPVPASSLILFRNGLKQTVGIDFQLMGNTITFLVGSAPQPADALVSSYRR